MLNVYAIGDWGESSALVLGMGWAAQQQTTAPPQRPQQHHKTDNRFRLMLTHLSLSHSFLTLAFLSRVRWQPRPGALMIFPEGEPKNLRHLTLDSIKLVCLRNQFWEKLQLLIIHLKLNNRGLETSNPTTLNVNGITILSNEHKAISSCNKRVSLLFGRTLKGVS